MKRTIKIQVVGSKNSIENLEIVPQKPLKNIMEWNKNLRQCPLVDDVLVSIINLKTGESFTWFGFRNSNHKFLLYFPTGLEPLPDHWQIKPWMELPKPI